MGAVSPTDAQKSPRRRSLSASTLPERRCSAPTPDGTLRRAASGLTHHFRQPLDARSLVRAVPLPPLHIVFAGRGDWFRPKLVDPSSRRHKFLLALLQLRHSAGSGDSTCASRRSRSGKLDAQGPQLTLPFRTATLLAAAPARHGQTLFALDFRQEPSQRVAPAFRSMIARSRASQVGPVPAHFDALRRGHRTGPGFPLFSWASRSALFSCTTIDCPSSTTANVFGFRLPLRRALSFDKSRISLRSDCIAAWLSR